MLISAAHASQLFLSPPASASLRITAHRHNRSISQLHLGPHHDTLSHLSGTSNAAPTISAKPFCRYITFYSLHKWLNPQVRDRHNLRLTASTPKPGCLVHETPYTLPRTNSSQAAASRTSHRLIKMTLALSVKNRSQVVRKAQFVFLAASNTWAMVVFANGWRAQGSRAIALTANGFLLLSVVAFLDLPTLAD